MMRLFLAIIPIFLVASPCTKCNLNKDQMKCEYYVAKMGDTSRQDSCKRYAEYLDETKVYGRASWYYLLGGEPKKAIEAGKKALAMGERYAGAYVAEGLIILGKRSEAKKYRQKSINMQKDIEILKRLYKDVKW